MSDKPYTLTKLENGTTQLNVNFFPKLYQDYFDIFGLKQECKNEPITVVKYENITYTSLDDETILIEGDENCQGRISWKAYYSLQVFGYLKTEKYKYFDENKGTMVTKSWYVAYPYPDEVKTIKIGANIKYLDHTSKKEIDSDSYSIGPFFVYTTFDLREEEVKPRHCYYLETIDLSECDQLQYVRRAFICENNVKKVIFPKHNFNTDPQIDLWKQELINKEFAEYKPPPPADDGCCNIH